MENDNNVNGNLNDNSVLDALVLTRNQWKSGIVKAVIFTLIAVIIFFVPVTVKGSTDVTFGIIYKNIKAGPCRNVDGRTYHHGQRPGQRIREVFL